MISVFLFFKCNMHITKELLLESFYVVYDTKYKNILKLMTCIKNNCYIACRLRSETF